MPPGRSLKSSHPTTIAELLHSEIASRIELQYRNLPASFRLKTPLKQCTAKSPFERDFLVSTSLNHLHVQFLLHLALLDHLADPDPQILEVSQQILALVVEAILLRDNLANSGTGLIWKVASTVPVTRLALILKVVRLRTMVCLQPAFFYWHNSSSVKPRKIRQYLNCGHGKI